MTGPGAAAAAGANGLEIVAISLASAHERRSRLAARLEGFPVPWKIFEAQTSAPAELPYRAAESALRRGRALRPGELAAFGSHYKCLREFVAAGETPYRLVIEDDIYLDPGFPYASLPRLMSATGIEYLRLHATFLRSGRLVAHLRKYRQLVRFRSPTFGACAYVISREGARRFLASLEAIVRPIDDELDRFWHNGLPPYAIYPGPALELYGATTIGEHDPRARQGALVWMRYRVNRSIEWLRGRVADLALLGRDRRIRKAVRRLMAAGEI